LSFLSNRGSEVKAPLLSAAATIALLSLDGGFAAAADVFRINGGDDVWNFLVTCDTSCEANPPIEAPPHATNASPASSSTTISDSGPAALPSPAGADPSTGPVNSFALTFGNATPTTVDTRVYIATKVGHNVSAVAKVEAAKAAGLFDALPEPMSWSLTVPIAGTLLISESPGTQSFNGSSVFTGPEDTPPATRAIRIRHTVETAVADTPAAAPKGFTFDYSTTVPTDDIPQTTATTSSANDASSAAADADTNSQTGTADTTNDADATPDTSVSSPDAAPVLYVLTGTNPGTLSPTVANRGAAGVTAPNTGQSTPRTDVPVVADAPPRSVFTGSPHAATNLLPHSDIAPAGVTSISVTVTDRSAEPTYQSMLADAPTDPFASIVDSLDPYRPVTQRQ
jgi:hypothetical protein